MRQNIFATNVITNLPTIATLTHTGVLIRYTATRKEVSCLQGPWLEAWLFWQWRLPRQISRVGKHWSYLARYWTTDFQYNPGKYNPGDPRTHTYNGTWRVSAQCNLLMAQQYWGWVNTVWIYSLVQSSLASQNWVKMIAWDMKLDKLEMKIPMQFTVWSEPSFIRKNYSR